MKTASFATFPTPVFRARSLEADGPELWVKNDGLTSALYGGNKVRKLELLLSDARARGARRIVTVGAAGSHHALATAVFAPQLGLRAAAILCPQRATAHAERTLRAALDAGLEVYPAGHFASTPFKLASVLRRGDYFVPPGGSNTLGALGYAHAMTELAAQIRRGELPEPDCIVVAVGSGGTAAGLLAGLLRTELKSSIVGVRVGGYAPLTRGLVVSLAMRTLRALGAKTPAARVSRRFVAEHGYIGRGYGWPTLAAESALAAGARVGLELDLTYTAKAFAKALELASSPFGSAAGGPHGPMHRPERRPLRVLYWHTLSAVHPAPSEHGFGVPRELPKDIADLFLRGAL